MPREPKLATQIQQLLAANHLLSVRQIIQFLHSGSINCNKTSVYRALDKMLKDEVICQHYFKDAQALYELREDHHTHLVCKKCDKVSMVECDYKHAPQVEDFRVDHHHLTLMGVCAGCG